MRKRAYVRACARVSLLQLNIQTQQVLIYLCCVFSHNLRNRVSENKSEKKMNKSVGVCLPCCSKMKAHCATSSTLRSEMSLLARSRKKEGKKTNSWLDLYSVFLSSLLSFSQIATVVFEAIKKDLRLTRTFRN